jgi:hypothetical protein
VGRGPPRPGMAWPIRSIPGPRLSVERFHLRLLAAAAPSLIAVPFRARRHTKIAETNPRRGALTWSWVSATHGSLACVALPVEKRGGLLRCGHQGRPLAVRSLSPAMDPGARYPKGLPRCRSGQLSSGVWWKLRWHSTHRVITFSSASSPNRPGLSPAYQHWQSTSEISQEEWKLNEYPTPGQCKQEFVLRIDIEIRLLRTYDNLRVEMEKA